MIELLIALLAIVLVFGIIWYCLSIIPLPPPFGVVAQLILLVILILIVLYAFLPLVHLRPLP